MQVVQLRASKMVGFFNFEEGAGVKVDGSDDRSTWGLHVDHLNTEIKGDGSLEDKVIAHLEKYLDVPTGWLTPAHLNVMDDGRIGLTVIEDGDSKVITGDSYDGQAYICDYDFDVEVMQVHTPSRQEIHKLFPNMHRCGH